MTERETIKAGPVTLALGLIAGGLGLLLYNFEVVKSLNWLWKWWPVLLIAVGAEYFIKKYHFREEVRFHVPSLLLILVLIVAGSLGYTAAYLDRGLNGLLNGLSQDNFSSTRAWEAESQVMKEGDTLSIENKTGTVKLLQAEGNELKVRAVIHARGSESDIERVEKLTPRIDREGSVLYLRPPEPQHYRNVVTDFEVLVPAGVPVRVDGGLGRMTAEKMKNDLELKGNTGTMQIREIAGNVSLRNNTGKIEVYEPGGDLLAENHTGSIEVISGQVLTRQYQLRTSTGGIRLELPRQSDLVLNARSNTGSISLAGIAGSVEGSGAGKRYTGTLGQGTGRMDLEVSTGSIQIDVK